MCSSDLLWLLLGAGAAQATWNASWTHRAKITLNTAAEGVPLAAAVDNAPVLVRLHTGNFQFLDAKPDGSDLRFIAADDKTPLKHHIEKYDAVNELALVWVQLPRLTPGSKAESIWVYYGNDKAPPANDPHGTYDAQQALVMHFAEGEALPQDSTANANHATRNTAKASTSGLIGGGLAFDGNAELALNVSPSMKASSTGWTLSMWIKPGELTDALLYSQQDAAASLTLQLAGGQLVAKAGTQIGRAHV